MRQTEAGLPIDPDFPSKIDPLSPVGRKLGAFAANYASVQYHFVQFLTDHLVDSCRTFGGDFDQVIILAVLGQRFLDAVAADASEAPEHLEKVWMSAMRIADVTSLPRETVRRKLKALEAKGWVKQKRGKGWAVVRTHEGSPARKHLAGIEERGHVRLARLFVALEQILKAAG